MSVKVEGAGFLCSLLSGLEVTCPSNTEKVGGLCQPACKAGEVRSRDGSCSVPAILAEVQSKLLEIKLQKENSGLDGIVLTRRKNIHVSPAGEYNLTWTHDLVIDGNASWVRTGSPTSIQSKVEEWLLPIYFDPTNIKDGASVSARLKVTGRSGSVPALHAEIVITSSIEATPSLDMSTIHFAHTVTRGQSLIISIDARDEDGIKIDEARGRFCVMAVQGPSSKVVEYQSIFVHGRCASS